MSLGNSVSDVALAIRQPTQPGSKAHDRDTSIPHTVLWPVWTVGVAPFTVLVVRNGTLEGQTGSIPPETMEPRNVLSDWM